MSDGLDHFGRLHRLLAMSALAACCFCNPITSNGQTSVTANTVANKKHDQPTPRTLQTIVVTARRRAESIEDVPIAITALSNEQLKDRGITNIADLQGTVPSLAVGAAAGQSRGADDFTVRGQGTSYTAAPAVVVYTSGVPAISGISTSLQGGPGKLLDVESVQVLRGPQGTLFGRNTTGGAVLITPNAPTPDLSAHLTYGTGNYGAQSIEGVFNTPVTSTFDFRIAATYVNRDGFTKDVTKDVKYDNKHYWKVRASAIWKPNRKFSNYLSVDAGKSSTRGSGYILEDVNSTYINAVFSAIGGCAGVGLGTDCSNVTGLVRHQSTRETDLDGRLSTKVKNWSVIDKATYHFSDNVAIHNTFSFGSLKADQPYDGDGTPYDLYNPLVGEDVNSRQFTEELRLAGSARSGKLHYTTGLYFEHNYEPSGIDVRNYIFLSESGQYHKTSSTSRAIYGQLTYDLGDWNSALDGLDATFGYRRTIDKMRGSGALYSINAATGRISGCANGVVSMDPTSPSSCALFGRQDYGTGTWTYGLAYHLGHGALVYANVSRGYKAGGLNFGTVDPDEFTYLPEFDKTYELGAKSTFRVARATVQVNADVFRTAYSDIQQLGPTINVSVSPPVQGTAIFNAASARVKGFEVEWLSRLPGGWEVGGSFSRLLSGYRSFVIQNPTGQLDCSGKFVVGRVDLSCIPLVNTPSSQANLMLAYRLPVRPDVGYVRVAGTYGYISGRYTAPTAVPSAEPYSRLGSHSLINVSVNWDSIFGSRFDVSAFASNVANKSYRIANTDVFSTLGVAASLYGAPRMFGIRVTYEWP